jgi:hypothetical protein
MALLHQHATARHLGLLRIWVFSFWLADIAKDPIAQLAGIPLQYFRPFGLMRWLPGFEALVHSPLTLRAFWATLLLFLILSALGTRLHHLIASTTCVLLTLYLGLIFGFAEVTHGPLAALYVTYLLALFPSADGLSIRRSQSRLGSPAMYRAAMLASTGVFLATYMFVGVRRVLAGGIDIFLDGTILRTIAVRSAQPDFIDSTLGLQIMRSPALSTAIEVGFLVVTAFEILSLLCLTSTWFRRAWIAVMVPFHVLTWPLMQVLFVHNLLLIGVLLVDLEGLERRLATVPALRRLGVAPGS